MAEFDKNLVMGMLQNLLGESGADSNPAGAESSDTKNQSVSLPVSPSASDTDDLINTAAMMSQFTDMMGKFRKAQNTKEAALLSALKPYLRASRQPKVDTMLRALQAFHMFSDMKKSSEKRNT